MAKCMTHLGRYELVEDIGRGAMGMVLKARDPLIERSVAIKTAVCDALPNDDAAACARRFFAEAQCAGRLNHPNIVTIYDVGRDDAVAFITMEFVSGRSLRELLDSGVVLGPDRIVDIAAQVADGLAFAHAQGVVHCDIKPANVMLQEDGRVKIADFGVALAPAGPLAQAGTAVGSPKYMSPEQATGQTIDGRSDIFSLGSVLYEMLTGAPPFAGPSIEAVLYQVLNIDPAAPSSRRRNLHPGFDVIVAKALAKDPARRYRTAMEFALDLRRYRELASLPSEPAAAADPITVGLPEVQTASARSWPVGRAVMATAMVLTIVVVGRFAQPSLFQSGAGNEALAARSAPPPIAERKTRTTELRAVATPASDTAGPAHRKTGRAAGGETHWLVKTKTTPAVRPAEPAPAPVAVPVHAVAPSQDEKPAPVRVVAAAKPEKTVSPEQLCADRSNFLSRGFCETRVCLQAEWKDDAFCVRKREQDMRSNPILAGGN
jgi:hypothetical protein